MDSFLVYLPLILLWFFIFSGFRKKRKNKAKLIKKIIQKKSLGGNTEMKELAIKFINKDCIIYSFDGDNQYTGIIKEVTDGAILIESNGKLEALNLEYVSRIREYPTDKNGKKKSVVLD